MPHYLVRLTCPRAATPSPEAVGPPCLEVILPAVAKAGGRLESAVFGATETDVLFLMEASAAGAQVVDEVARGETGVAIEVTPLVPYVDASPAGNVADSFWMLPPQTVAEHQHLRGATPMSAERAAARRGSDLRGAQVQASTDRLAARARALRQDADELDAEGQEATERHETHERAHGMRGVGARSGRTQGWNDWEPAEAPLLDERFEWHQANTTDQPTENWDGDDG